MRVVPSCILTVAVLSITASPALSSDALFPRPTAEALAKAEANVKEIYKADLAKAIKPKDKSALAAVLLKAADSVGQDDASRFVLWTIARDLAETANDSRLAMIAVTNIVGRFQPDGETDPQKQIELGNAAWKQAETASASEHLRLRTKAAEWYLRAKPVATGLDEILITKRLGELAAAQATTPALKRTYNVSLVSSRGHKHVFSLEAIDIEDARAQVAHGFPTAHSIRIEEK